MTDLYVSIFILVAYILICVGYKLRVDQLHRRRDHARRIRQIKAYTVRKPDTRYSNVYPLDNYSRRVDAA